MLSPGTILQQRYRIIRELARGGMGAVYEAEAVHLRNAPIAVKETFFRAEQQQLREQFEREAATLARLSHPALPQIKDHFREGDGQFLVMNFIPGDDLGVLLERQLKDKGAPFGWGLVLEWADRLLDALAYIHGQYPPVIHRDIKPANLKLTPRGELFLLDFGLAKDATTPTRPGYSLRAYTLEFAPLEQIKGLGTDVRSDLYSLGATLYYLLTGKFPADARVRDDAMNKHLMPDLLVPAHQLNPQVPFTLAAVLAKAMALDRKQRYPDAASMREALRQAKESIEAELAGRQHQEEQRLLEGTTGKQLEEGERLHGLEKKEGLGERKLELRSEGSEQITSASRRKFWLLMISGAVLSIVLLGWLMWQRNNSSEQAAKPFEVLRYRQEYEPGAGKDGFRFHFTARAGGYLYLVAPDEQKRLTTLLTNRPPTEMGVQTNQLQAGREFAFPANEWLGLSTASADFTLIFSPAPLTQSGFLSAREVRMLTAAELRMLDELRRQSSARAPVVEATGTGGVIMASGKQSVPIVIEITARRKASLQSLGELGRAAKATRKSVKDAGK